MIAFKKQASVKVLSPISFNFLSLLQPMSRAETPVFSIKGFQQALNLLKFGQFYPILIRT